MYASGLQYRTQQQQIWVALIPCCVHVSPGWTNWSYFCPRSLWFCCTDGIFHRLTSSLKCCQHLLFEGMFSFCDTHVSAMHVKLTREVSIVNSDTFSKAVTRNVLSISPPPEFRNDIPISTDCQWNRKGILTWQSWLLQRRSRQFATPLNFFFAVHITAINLQCIGGTFNNQTF